MTLAGKFALVTGAGSGIGRASALSLAKAGAEVAVLGRTREELTEVAEEIRASGHEAHVLVADISDETQMRAAFDDIRASYERLDIVFANAGINGTWAPVDELSFAEWNRTLNVNLGGTFLTVHFAVPLMREHGGSVIITSSINGTRTFTTAGASAYSASKAAQLAFGQMAALELARYQIRVNVICPGAIETGISASTEKRNVEKAKHPAEYPEGTVPLTGGRRGKPEDVAELVAFLASDQARHITGTPIWIDGAQSLLI